VSDHHVHVISAGLEAPKLMKLQTFAKELMSGGMVDPDVVAAMMNTKSMLQAEYILKKGIAKKKEEMANMEQLQQQLEESANNIKQLEAEIDRLNNMHMEVEKAKIEAQKEQAKATNDLASRRLALDSKVEDKKLDISEEELQLKKQVAQLEREQLLHGSGKEVEVNNNKV